MAEEIAAPASPLALNEKLPRVTVSTASGPLKLSSYEQRRNLLMLLMDAEQEENAGYLRRLAELNDDLVELGTVVLVINPGTEPRRAPAEFTSAADASGSFRKRYLAPDAPPDAVGLWLSDRFGELYHQSIALRARDLTPPEEVLQWVWLVEAQCP